MGVEKFTQFHKEVFKNRTNFYRIGELYGKHVVIDFVNRLYKTCIGMRSSGQNIYNKYGEDVSHIYAVFNFTTGLISSGIQPIYVIDGKPPAEKSGTLKIRENRKRKAQEKCETIDDKTSSEYVRHFKNSFYMSSKILRECKQLLDLMGIPYVSSIGEADQQCASLSKHYSKQISGVITEDSDILIFGGTCIFKDFSLKTKDTSRISYNDIIKSMAIKSDLIRKQYGLEIIDFTYENFIDFTILMGSFYTDKDGNDKKMIIRGINHDGIFKLFVKNNFKIETVLNILKENRDIIIPDGFELYIIDKKHKYMFPEIIDPATININVRDPQRIKLMNFLCDDFGFDVDFTKMKIKTLVDNYTVSHTMIKQHGRFDNFRSYQIKRQHLIRRDCMTKTY